MSSQRLATPLTTVVTTALVLSIVSLTGCGPGGDLPPGHGVVEEVVDGDTLVITVGGRKETVRLIGIDTPETKDPRVPVMCFGPEASARLGELTPPGSEVRLELDVEVRDRYDRLLAYVHRAGDDLFVNLAMVEEGLADSVSYPPNETYRPVFDAAASDARAKQRGLWAACGGIETPIEP
ncbi:MAG: Thermonuclease [Acidimicrobiales bacterium]|nr:MAG: hypothetical protein EDR02_17270 [Actinomycetota bacterium]MBV6508289.1 Thermonuclease [Acidimicrobiales bacterium]RIK07073.1 MAG: hypothetical protein DCC48_04580 [Acidobacteriota bacterium]